MDIHIKRVYEEPCADDGLRVLVDRLWPRGLKRETAALDYWFKELAPSPPLRRWFGHDPERFEEFRQRYIKELQGQPQGDSARELLRLGKLTTLQRVCLLYGARDREQNHAAVLAAFLINFAEEAGF